MPLPRALECQSTATTFDYLCIKQHFMAGIYIHVPFCRQACHYCNFHFSVSHRHIHDYTQSILNEIELSAEYLKLEGIEYIGEKPKVDSIYLGGGTPSLLETNAIQNFFSKLANYYAFDHEGEFTLEANPDDLSIEKLHALKETPINRLSIGIQSFHQADLKYMNRIHSPAQAIDSIKNAQKSGFQNLTIDLIFGIPGLSDEAWRDNISRTLDLGIQHISAYSLTVEPGTALELFIRKGKAKPVSDSQSARQFEILIQMLEDNEYLHYEISNFAREGFFSRHNTSYWQGKPYLGLGPSAHSFNGLARRWNIANTTQYIEKLKNRQMAFEEEILSQSQRYNEYVMTALRTLWGVKKSIIAQAHGENTLLWFLKEIKPHINSGLAVEEEDCIKLSRKGRLFADRIASDCFLVD